MGRKSSRSSCSSDSDFEESRTLAVQEETEGNNNQYYMKIVGVLALIGAVIYFVVSNKGKAADDAEDEPAKCLCCPCWMGIASSVLGAVAVIVCCVCKSETSTTTPAGGATTPGGQGEDKEAAPTDPAEDEPEETQ